MKDLEHKIQVLLESKDYETLNSEEVLIVSRLYTEEDYRDMRNTVLQFQEIFEASALILPQAESLEILNAKFDKTEQEEKAPSILLKLLAYRIPLYQPVAASLLLLIGYFTLFNSTTPNIVSFTEPKTEEVFITRTIRDTVYIIKPEIITQTKNVYVKATQKPKPTNTRYPETEQPFIPKVSIPNNDEIVSSFGNTSINQEQAEQFKVSL